VVGCARLRGHDPDPVLADRGHDPSFGAVAEAVSPRWRRPAGSKIIT
jgi:hypothetical protein